MAREIKSERDISLRNPQEDADNFRERFIKLIPTEIIAIYLISYTTVSCTLTTYDTNIIVWGIIGLLFLFTPIYLYKFCNVSKISQLSLTTFGFPFWAMTIGTPLETIYCYTATCFGAVMLLIYILFVPLFYKG